MTVARMLPSIVISNMMIRFGHQATIGMLPVGSGHASSVMRVSHVASEQTNDPADGGNPIHRRGLVAVTELVLLDRLGRDDDDLAFRQSGGEQTVEGALHIARIGVEAVHRFHGLAAHKACSRSSSSTFKRNGCSPTLSSHTEIIGTSFAKSV